MCSCAAMLPGGSACMCAGLGCMSVHVYAYACKLISCRCAQLGCVGAGQPQGLCHAAVQGFTPSAGRGTSGGPGLPAGGDQARCLQHLRQDCEWVIVMLLAGKAGIKRSVIGGLAWCGAHTIGFESARKAPQHAPTHGQAVKRAHTLCAARDKAAPGDIHPQRPRRPRRAGPPGGARAGVTRPRRWPAP